MKKRQIPYFGYHKETQDKIMDVAIKLFATYGYGATSIKDIAEGVGIKSGSIYNYYKGKEDIFNAAMERFEKEYQSYFDWLRSVNEKAETLEEVMDNMFSELIRPRDLSVYYGISFLRKEQFTHAGAQERVFRIFYINTIEWIQEGFDRLIEKGVIPQSNTKIISTILMWCVMGSVDLRLHDSINSGPPLNNTETNLEIKTFLTDALRKGQDMIPQY